MGYTLRCERSDGSTVYYSGAAMGVVAAAARTFDLSDAPFYFRADRLPLPCPTTTDPKDATHMSREVAEANAMYLGEVGVSFNVQSGNPPLSQRLRSFLKQIPKRWNQRFHL